MLDRIENYEKRHFDAYASRAEDARSSGCARPPSTSSRLSQLLLFATLQQKLRQALIRLQVVCRQPELRAVAPSPIVGALPVDRGPQELQKQSPESLLLPDRRGPARRSWAPGASKAEPGVAPAPRSSGPCPSIVGPRSFKSRARSRSCSPIVGALPVDRGPQELQKQRQSSIREKENKIKSKSKIKTEAAHEREQ